MIIPAAKAQEAANALGIGLTDLTHKDVTAAFRTKAKECHPDKHGNSKLQMWAQIEWARECLKRWLDQHPAPVEEIKSESVGDCRACGGTGRIKVGRGGFGNPLTMMCQMCRGDGTVTPQENDSDIS